jgi:hypothetical protein
LAQSANLTFQLLYPIAFLGRDTGAHAAIYLCNFYPSELEFYTIPIVLNGRTGCGNERTLTCDETGNHFNDDITVII